GGGAGKPPATSGSPPPGVDPATKKAIASDPSKKKPGADPNSVDYQAQVLVQEAVGLRSKDLPAAVQKLDEAQSLIEKALAAGNMSAKRRAQLLSERNRIEAQIASYTKGKAAAAYDPIGIAQNLLLEARGGKSIAAQMAEVNKAEQVINTALRQSNLTTAQTNRLLSE